MKQFTALVLVIMLLCLAACGSGTEPEPSASQPVSSENTAAVAQTDETGEAETTTLPEESSTVPESTSDGGGETSTAPKETSETAAVQAKLPKTKAEILSAYTKVVNKVKTDMPKHYNNDWQTVSNVDMGGALYGVLSTAAGSFLETKEESSPGLWAAGTHAEYFALPAETLKEGCVLTDTSKIESASCTKSGDSYVIKITLMTEKDPDKNHDNPRAVKGWHGKMFDVIDITQVTEYAKKIPGVNTSNAYCTFKGTATLKYNPATNECITLDHIIDVRVFLGSGAAKVIADYHFYGFEW